VTGGGEAGHVGADLGDDRLRGGAANAGDLIQPLDRRGERGDLGLDLAVQLGDVGAAWSMRASIVASRKA
jgi:hypothetical protein